jgi:copper chaperone CopZ
MKKRTLFFILVTIVSAATIMACNRGSKKTSDTGVKTEPVAIEVSIAGMHCTGCEETIQMRVGDLEGVKSVKASWQAGNAFIEFYPDKVDTSKIRERINSSGYSVNKFIIP